MTTIELEAWKKIVDNPREEVRALFKRRELTFADIHDDPLSWHMQAALWGILRCLDDAFSRFEYDRDEPSDRGPNDYFHWEALANRTFSLGMLRAIREHADEMTAVLADRKCRDQMLRDQIAESIRSELVCPCDSAAKADGLYDRENMEPYREFIRSADYHAMCHYGEWSARIAEGNS